MSANAHYMYGAATGGFQAPSSTGTVNYTNLRNSGTLDFANIDNTAGNLIGKISSWLIRFVYEATAAFNYVFTALSHMGVVYSLTLEI